MKLSKIAVPLSCVEDSQNQRSLSQRSEESAQRFQLCDTHLVIPARRVKKRRKRVKKKDLGALTERSMVEMVERACDTENRRALQTGATAHRDSKSSLPNISSTRLCGSLTINPPSSPPRTTFAISDRAERHLAHGAGD